MLQNLLTPPTDSHRAGASFDSEAAAEAASNDVVNDTGIASERVRIISPGDRGVDLKLDPESRQVVGTRFRSLLVMGGIGVGVGAVLAAFLVFAGIEPFAATAPASVIAIMVAGTLFGLLTGVFVGIRPKHDPLDREARKATRLGQWFVVVHAVDDEERNRAQGALDAAAGGNEQGH